MNFHTDSPTQTPSQLPYPEPPLLTPHTFPHRGVSKLTGAGKRERLCLTHVGFWGDFPGLAAFAGFVLWQGELHRLLLRQLWDLHLVGLIWLSNDGILITVILVEKGGQNRYSRWWAGQTGLYFAGDYLVGQGSAFKHLGDQKFPLDAAEGYCQETALLLLCT